MTAIISSRCNHRVSDFRAAFTFLLAARLETWNLDQVCTLTQAIQDEMCKQDISTIYDYYTKQDV
jgi:hypothetical protein